jgi:hypothetical protein
MHTYARTHTPFQVHRARVRIPSSNGNEEVVVKVRHPGVATSISRDFQLLKPLASFASRCVNLPGLWIKFWPPFVMLKLLIYFAGRCVCVCVSLLRISAGNFQLLKLLAYFAMCVGLRVCVCVCMYVCVHGCYYCARCTHEAYVTLYIRSIRYI